MGETNAAMQKRNQRAENLRVYQTDAEDYWVESSDAKIAYHVYFNFERDVGRCTCPDYQTRVKSDGDFKCKHILAVADASINHDTQPADYIEKSKPRIDDRFISSLKGKDFVIYSGLLDLAHQRGLMKLEVKTLQLPTKENGFEAICHAVAESKNGGVFSDVGDANPKNVNSIIASHIIRMASTRAKARALRDMTNIGMTCLEELGDLNEVIGSNNVVDIKTRRSAQTKKQETAKPAATNNSGNGTGKAASKPKAGTAKSGRSNKATPAEAKAKAQKKESANKPASDNGNGAKMSEAQKRALMNLSRRRGISVDDVEKMSQETFNCAVDNLSTSDAASFIRNLQQAA